MTASEAKACLRCRGWCKKATADDPCDCRCHDAPPQPAPSQDERMKYGEAALAARDVQPAPAGFEEALSDILTYLYWKSDTFPSDARQKAREACTTILRAYAESRAAGIEEGKRDRAECEQVAQADYHRGVEDGKRKMAREALDLSKRVHINRVREWLEAQATGEGEA